jgi:hypothetical protein
VIGSLAWYLVSYVPLLVKSKVQTQVSPLNDRLSAVEVQSRLLPKNPSAVTELPDIIMSAGGDQYKLKAAFQATADLMNDAREQNARFRLQAPGRGGNG